MMFSIFEKIERLIAEHGSASILRERLELLHTQLALLKQKMSELDQENRTLAAQLTEAKNKLAANAIAEQFHEERGALFKRAANGRYINVVYCPRCHLSTSSFPPGERFHCDCGWSSNFDETELPDILGETSP